MSFDFDFTIDKFAKCINNSYTASLWFDLLHKTLPEYEIITPRRVSGFITQCQASSNNFVVLEENLNLPFAELQEKYKRFFPAEAIAKKYEFLPEAIANKIYANRNGNGPESSHDGWKFRERGLIKISGRGSYTLLSEDLFSGKLLPNPDMLTTPANAVVSSCWIWKINNLNRWSDSMNIGMMSRKANTYKISLSDQMDMWNRNLEILEN